MDRILPYWSANMATLWDMGMSWWPGFNYTAEEQALMRSQAQRVGGRGAIYGFAVAVLFIAGLGVIVPAALLPLLNWLYPDFTQIGGLVFAVLLATVAAFSLGLWLPLAMALAARAVDLLLGRPRDGAWGAAEQALAQRVRWQLQRMALIMSGLLVPGIMAFIIFDIDTRKGPLHFLLQAADLIVIVGTLFYLRAAGRRRRASEPSS